MPPTGQSIGDACPGLFYPTAAQDGFLVRIRLPGGRLNVMQAEYLAAIAQAHGQGQLWLTNRSNVQLRLTQPMPELVLAQLQGWGLAAVEPTVDHLRNIMASPTAGLDRSALIDVMPLVQAIDDYLSSHPELATLSAKFSIGLDGGESVSIRDRRNDIWFVAQSFEQLRVYFGADDTGMLLGPDDVVGMVAAIGRIYLDVAPQISENGARRKSRKPRWREIVDYVGWVEVCDRLNMLGWRNQLAGPLNPPILGDFDRLMSPQKWGLGGGSSGIERDIGSHPQNDDRHYVGIVIPFGKLQSSQLLELAELAETHGNGELRLTPWQNVVIPNVTHPHELQVDLSQLGYRTDSSHPAAALVACSGSPGCAASFTSTQSDALQIVENLQIDRPINIHVSGCSKGCAQPYASDIALMGMASGNYDLYTRSGNQVFGDLARSNIAPIDLPQVIREVVEC